MFSTVMPFLARSAKFVFMSLLLTTLVIGLQKPYTKTEVGMDFVMYDVYLKTRNVDVKSRIKLPEIHFQDQKDRNVIVQTITESMKQYAEYATIKQAPECNNVHTL